MGKEFVASRLDDDGVLVLGPAGLVKRRCPLVIDKQPAHKYNLHWPWQVIPYSLAFFVNGVPSGKTNLAFLSAEQAATR